MTEHDGQRFDRLPATDADRTDPDRPTREEVLEWWEDRFDIDQSVFADFSFWERGRGKIWITRGDAPDPIAIEGLGMTFLRTRSEYWKPTTDAVQRFGHLASKNVITLSAGEAAAFISGYDQNLDWDGDWGYLIAAIEIDDERVLLGVGLYVHGELQSMISKGRRRDFDLSKLK
ncbi:hypothetical protein K0C01_02225 [Salinarchaeum sp. IM2453]|uniref:DUF7122 family protein n=1 Tax=Salinarchaeum sp. IM2453 TaxID=2862870 RepID=UPI001C8384A8|nr:hypothetical protein [Salinarchaeum sp. IM2453]QZA89003.1 hypothetical protein K0C01_02225 [Salinarchaeum sp. IM2453]